MNNKFKIKRYNTTREKLNFILFDKTFYNILLGDIEKQISVTFKKMFFTQKQ